MYCNQCGNLIPENGAFCTFCGAKAEGAAPAASPVKPAPVPLPSVVREPQQEIALTAKKNDEKPEKYYTTKHIVLCLAVAGIMAVAAGVFAGLYFSVI